MIPNGPFGNMFPYTNFHSMNLDWVIQVAKDFLDQYTNIQQTITDGLDALDAKKEELEALLQAWYDEHSEDIANQLASALEDLNTWYTTHQNYLNDTLTEKTNIFNSLADQKTTQSIGSIPASYNALAEQVEILTSLETFENLFNGEYFEGILSDTTGQPFGTTVSVDADYGYTHLIPISSADTLFAIIRMDNPNQTLYAHYYDADNEKLDSTNGMGIVDNNIPANTASVSIVFQKAYMDTLVINKNKAPTYPAKFNEHHDYIRLDHGRAEGWYPTGTGTYPMYPLTYLASVMCTYPIEIPEDENVYFYCDNLYFSHNYYDAQGLYISTEVSSYVSGQLTIPATAKYIIGYSGASAVPTKYAYLNIDHVPAYIPELTEEYPDTAIKGKQILMFGDSIISGYYYGGGWATILKDIYKAKFVNNQGHDGWEVSRNPNVPDNCLIDLIDDFQPTGYDMVVLSGGINDCSRLVTIGTIPQYTFYDNTDESDFAPAVFNYLKKCRDRYIDQKIVYLLTPYKEWNNNNVSAKQREAWAVIREACDKFGIEVIDLAENGGLVGIQVDNYSDPRTSKYFRNADGTHPNYDGYKYMSAYIANKISEQFKK